MSQCRRSLTCSLVLALLCGLAAMSSAQVQQALLSDLYAGAGPNGNGSIVVGDKTFWFFGTVLGENLQDQFVATNFGTTAAIPTPGDIVVTGLLSVGPLPGPGIAFTSKVWSVNATESQDTALHYVVTTGNNLTPAGGPNWITDASMSFGGAGTTGAGTIHLGETFEDENKAGLGGLVVEMPGATSADTVFATPQNWIFVSKDFLLNSNGAGTAFISDLDQHFSQVPEPGSYAMMLGVVVSGGFAFLRRRAKA